MFEMSKMRPLVREMGRRLSALTALLAFSLFSAAPLLAQHEGAAGGEGGLFSINPGLMVWTWVIFIVLLLVLRKWAWRPILDALEARERRIQEALDKAAAEREEANRLLEEHRRLLDESRGQAQGILAQSRKAAERLRAELLDAARAEREKIVDGAREEIGRERDELLDELRRHAVDLSILAAGRVLKKNLDSRENRRLVDEYLDSLAAESESGAN